MVHPDILYGIRHGHGPHGPDPRPSPEGRFGTEKSSAKVTVDKAVLTKKGKKGETVSKRRGPRKLASHAPIASTFLQ